MAQTYDCSDDAPTLISMSTRLLSREELDFGATMLGLGPSYGAALAGADYLPDYNVAGLDDEEVPMLEEITDDEISVVEAPSPREALGAREDLSTLEKKTSQFDAHAYWELMECDTIDGLDDSVERLVTSVVTAPPPPEEPVVLAPRSIVPLAEPLPRVRSMPSIPPDGLDRCTWSPSGPDRSARRRGALLAALIVTVVAAGGAWLVGSHDVVSVNDVTSAR